MMKEKCPICGQGKSKRDCVRKNNELICARCCAEMRGSDCGECPHYIEALRYAVVSKFAKSLPDGKFIAEINPSVQEAVDAALEIASEGREDKAFEEMERLVAEHPRNHDVCYGMGTLHGMNGNSSEAVKWFGKAVTIFPYFPEAHYNMGVAYSKLYDIGNMALAYRKAVEYGDPQEEYYHSAKSGLQKMAEVIMQSSGVELDDYIVSSEKFKRAFELMESRQWASALKEFQAAAAYNDRNAPTHGNMALCYANLGRKAHALTEIDRALEIDPAYEPAITNRLTVERMEEGQALENAAFMSINYSHEQAEKKNSKTSSRRIYPKKGKKWSQLVHRVKDFSPFQTSHRKTEKD
jgi:Flp pilus assembly protein TadD